MIAVDFSDKFCQSGVMPGLPRQDETATDGELHRPQLNFCANFSSLAAFARNLFVRKFVFN